MNSWDFFDEISVITISKHHSRIQKLKQNFKKVHLYHYTIHNFKSAQKIVNDGKKDTKFSMWSVFNHSSSDETSFNIAWNHLSLIKNAYYNNKQSILIFENDAEFKLPFNFIQLQATIEWLKKNKWDIFYFGYCPIIPYITKQSEYIVKIHKPLLGHAYALSRSGMKQVLTQSYRLGSTQIDKYYTNIFKKLYGAYPILNFQNVEPAIYRRVKKKFGIPFTFNVINKGMEMGGLLFSLIFRLSFLILFFVIAKFFWKNNYIQSARKEI